MMLSLFLEFWKTDYDYKLFRMLKRYTPKIISLQLHETQKQKIMLKQVTKIV